MAVLAVTPDKPAYFHGGPMHGRTAPVCGRGIVLIPVFGKRGYPTDYARYLVHGQTKDGRLRYRFQPP